MWRNAFRNCWKEKKIRYIAKDFSIKATELKECAIYGVH